MKYFEHDTEAYKDDKIVLLRREHGGAAIDAYWTIIEIIYRNETELKPNANPSVFESVSFFLQVSIEELQTYIQGMLKYGLLVETDDGCLTSPRALENIDDYQSRCQKNRMNGAKGGRPRKTQGQGVINETKTSETKPNTNPEETETKPNANPNKPKWGDKEKEKEKEKEKKEILKKKNAPTGQFDLDEINDDGFAMFAKSALDAYNAEMSSSIDYLEPTTFQGLRRIFDSGRTIDDIVTVIRDKREEWQNDRKMRRFIRPSTLFGNKFEEYLDVASKQREKEADFDKYA